MKYKVNNKQKYYGITDFDKHLITINKKMAKRSGTRGELLDSLVHETEHAKHPKMKERTVTKRTPLVTKKLSKKQKARLYAKIKKG